VTRAVGPAGPLALSWYTKVVSVERTW